MKALSDRLRSQNKESLKHARRQPPEVPQGRRSSLRVIAAALLGATNYVDDSILEASPCLCIGLPMNLLFINKNAQKRGVHFPRSTWP